MLPVDLLPVEEIKFGIISGGDLRQVGNNLLLPSLRLALLNKLLQRFEVPVALGFAGFQKLFDDRKPRYPPDAVGWHFKRSMASDWVRIE